MAGDKDETTATAQATPIVPARRGYAISRIEAPPPPAAAAASNPPLSSAAPARSNSNKTGYENSTSASGDRGIAGPDKRQLKNDGGDGSGKGSGRRKRGGKGGGNASGAAGGDHGAVRPNGLNREPKATSPRPAHRPHEQQPVARARQPANGSRGGNGPGGAHNVDASRVAARDQGRRQYHHEHDDRAEAPPERRQPAARNPRQRQQQQSRANAENTATVPRVGMVSSGEVAADVRGRGGNRSGGGSSSILSRLGSPPRPPTEQAAARDGSSTDNGRSDFSRLGSPPPSPRNVLSRADDAGKKQGRRGGANRSKPAAVAARSVPGGPKEPAGKQVSGGDREPLPHPPRRGMPASADKKGRHQQQQQETQRSTGVARDDGVGGGSNGGNAPPPQSSSSFGVATHTAKGARDNNSGKRLERAKGALSGGSGGRNGGGAAPTVSEARTAAVVSHAAVLRAAAGGTDHNRVDRRGDHGNNWQPPHPQEQQERRQQHRKQPPKHPQQQRVHEGEYARGTCMSMCPLSEMRAREAEGVLSSFEATEATSKASVPFRQRVADPERVVKKYRRSAAGRDMQSPEQLRPLAVLQTTTKYLVQEVFATACSSSGGGGGGGGKQQRRGGSSTSDVAKAYVFVEDRLRAVRQDLTVQGLVLEGSAGAAEVLKTTANFYIVAGYLMTDEASDVFDRHLHTRELQGVFSSLAELFFQSKGVELSHPGSVQAARQSLGADEYLCLQAVHALATAISNGSKGGDAQLGEAAGGQGVSRVFTSTVSKLCNGGAGGGSSSPFPVSLTSQTGETMATGTDAIGGDTFVPTPSPLRVAFPKMAMAVHLLGIIYAGNWSEFFRVLGSGVPSDTAESRGSSLPLVLLVGDELASSPFAVRLRCLCHGMLLPVRAHALRAMNKAYGKGEKVPLADVARMLRVPDEEHAAGICRALSLPLEGSDNKDSNGGGSDQQATTRSDRAVFFKSVPAVWKSEEAKTTGFVGCASAHGVSGITRGGNHVVGGGRVREDEWVGLARALAAKAPSTTGKDKSSGSTLVTCDACAGFGCSWCDGGVVQAEEEVGPEDEGLWQAALRPTS